MRFFLLAVLSLSALSFSSACIETPCGPCNYNTHSMDQGDCPQIDNGWGSAVWYEKKDPNGLFWLCCGPAVPEGSFDTCRLTSKLGGCLSSEFLVGAAENGSDHILCCDSPNKDDKAQSKIEKLQQVIKA